MLQLIANGVCSGFTHALSATGFALIFSSTGVLHVAHGGVYTLSAYVLFALAVQAFVPFPLAVVAAIAAACALSILLERLVYRPLDLRKAPRTIILISSLGAYIVIANLLAMIFGSQGQVIRTGAEETIHFAGVTLTSIQVLQVIASLLILALYWLLLNRTRLGRSCRALADDSELAEAMGVPVAAVRVRAFVLGSILAAAASILMVLDVGVDPFVGFQVFEIAFVACVVGGLHRFFAPVLGALILRILQSAVVWKSSTAWEPAVTFGLLVLFLLLRPSGLLGERRRIEER